jgi:hypothetical protein
VSVSLEDEAHEEVESRGSSSGSSIKRNEEKRITEPKQAAPEERLNQYTGELRAKSLKSPIFRQAVFKHALVNLYNIISLIFEGITLVMFDSSHAFI